MADRKRKGKTISSSSQVTPRFKTLYHEAHFNSKPSARRILPELILQADEHVFNPIRFQIHQRKWEKFTKPIQAVGHLMVKEFYANAWESDKAKRKPLTYTSMVRGTEFQEMEMQGIPVTMANLAIHRQREEEINQERMRYERILQEAAAQQAREANKGKSREVVPDSEDEFVSSESEEF
ncbi:hypothetical protein PIB30_099153 [Stylosanthes scabra]|uniref:Uncharacterized protein n=1 Tax=Stylosanthes scabra TaxID=79078 RepID=A0ABU6YZQ2_9FABA|nr:hypothetical protein [Stylosanthes scabra]